MARNQSDSTEIADRIIELIGGSNGLSKIGARRLETVQGGIVFIIESEGYTQSVVVIREVDRKRYRVYVAHLDGWVEARQAHDVPPDRVRSVVTQLIGKKMPV